jgi:hypothetical protein
MAGTKGNKNAVGNTGGKSLQDRELAARVRSLALREIESALKNKADDVELYKGRAHQAGRIRTAETERAHRRRRGTNRTANHLLAATQ